ncbi:PREDICTED: neurogenic locus notch homolog protein 2-like [Branchiostoma belcheri]|uniref:Neurogenic locus notch homolog protein 2-like n=1 Tax=Branchiostoma belcheri TaxID=7741 RepID=A0A6P4ZP04_BRABE|nr:PREDICTED: neurogenic locus notch homolog protein 2-like [Branchiostoma belcheri]
MAWGMPTDSSDSGFTSFYKDDSSVLDNTTPSPSTSAVKTSDSPSMPAFYEGRTSTVTLHPHIEEATTDIKDCTKKGCKHGYCVNQDDGYKCTCPPGWTGHDCKQDIDECTENSCGHGSCENEDGGYKCTCSHGWTGQNCQRSKRKEKETEKKEKKREMMKARKRARKKRKN